MIDFTEYTDFFRLFDLMVRAQHDQIYCIYWNFSNFRLFELVLGGRNDWYNCINCFFFRFFRLLLGGQLSDFTGYIIFFRLFDFRPLAVSLKWLILQTILIFLGQIDWFYWIYWIFWPFDFSTSWREVKKINFTEYIVFFRLFNLLLGGQSYQFYWYIGFFQLFDFSTCCCEIKLIDFNEYIEFFQLFDCSTYRWEIKMINFT